MKRIFALLAALLLFYAPFFRAQPDQPTDKKIPLLIPETPQETLPVNNLAPLLLHAQLKLEQGIVLAVEKSGKLSKLKLQVGQRVKTGQLLASVACPNEQQQIKQARATLARHQQAKQQLAAIHSINTLEIASVNNGYTEAKANLSVAEALISRCTIQAPFNGVITKVFTKPAQIVSVGEPVLEIRDDSNQNVELIAPSQELALVKLGQHYQISQPNNPKQTYLIELTGVSGHIDTATQTIKLYGQLKNSTPVLTSLVALNHH
jgi:membrane fusion protein, multidrug efflux system